MQALLKYNCKFSYDKVSYCNSKTPVIIVCPTHGEFSQRPDVHLSKTAKVGCKKCRSFKPLHEWLSRFNTVHNFKYDYSDIPCITGTDDMLKIKCVVHGSFTQSLKNHITGRGCQSCARDYKSLLFRLPLSNLIARFNVIHGERYNYIAFDYKNRNGKVFYECEVHGVVSQAIGGHLAGKGCRQCHKGGFNDSKQGVLYFIKRENESVMKIGICNVLSKRLKSLKETTPFSFRLVKAFIFENGKQCYTAEKLCHSVLTSANYQGFNGCTEWFQIDNSLLNLLDFPPLFGAIPYC